MSGDAEPAGQKFAEAEVATLAEAVTELVVEEEEAEPQV